MMSKREIIENLMHYNVEELLEILDVCQMDIDDGNFSYNTKEDLVLKVISVTTN
tara:strand:- start:4953 stop:5114 length:162 start_codon:yes stop_codon:yes gene_type:complete